MDNKLDSGKDEPAFLNFVYLTDLTVSESTRE